MTSGELDRDVIERHLAAIGEAVRVLRTLSTVTRETLERDLATRWTVERGLTLCAQNALDVAGHVLSVLGRDAGDYTRALDGLGDAGVLPRDFASDFRRMAGFRNALVHMYLAVDQAIVHAVLTEKLETFTEFAAHVQRWLDTWDPAAG